MGSSFLGLLIRNLITDIIISYADLESVQNNLDSLGKCDEHEIGRSLLKKLEKFAGKLKSTLNAFCHVDWGCCLFDGIQQSQFYNQQLNWNLFQMDVNYNLNYNYNVMFN